MQNFESTLGMARGTWFVDVDGGSDLSDLYWRYSGSPWFDRMVMLEMVRLSSVPNFKNGEFERFPPFACVQKVNRVAVFGYDAETQRLRVDVQYELEGAGLWTGSLAVFILRPDQLKNDRDKAAAMQAQIKRI